MTQKFVLFLSHDMKIDPVQDALAALGQLLGPAVPLLMEMGVGLGDCTRVLEQLYVDAGHSLARGRAAKRTARPPISRISVITGLHRAKVAELLRSPPPPAITSGGRRHRAERVMQGWLADPDFRDAGTGQPAVLSLRGSGSTFTLLVKRHSGDPRVRTILQELKHVRAVRQHCDGRVELVRTTYAPPTLDTGAIAAAGECARDYLSTLIHNIRHPSRQLYARSVVNARFVQSEVAKVSRNLIVQAEATMDAVDSAVRAPAVTLGLREPDSAGARFGATLFFICEPYGRDPGHRRRRARRTVDAKSSTKKT